MPACLGIVTRDQVALDPGWPHLERLFDLRTDPSPDARSEIGDERTVGQMEIAAALPRPVEVLDRPTALILHEAGVLAPVALELRDEMGAEFRLENLRQRKNWRRRGGGSWLGPRQSRQDLERPIDLVQGSDVDDAQHRVEDDPGSVGAEGARHFVAVPQENDWGKSGFERNFRPQTGFARDGEERGLALVDQAPVGGERRKRGLRRGVVCRSEERQRDGAGKGSNAR
jgi:hypothetical protein